ncbi:MAG: LLM class F420-dependent oxidoreductase, partial [Acidimicrobiia bacterium]|nr:LLM class F420-dependent oxidoreductase [Acidimicrobiia bacterium]
MEIGLHIPHFAWPEGPEGIGATLGAVAERVDDAGFASLSVMDHWFQMDQYAPATDPMLEGYATLAWMAAKTTNVQLRLLVTGVTYRHPGLLAKTVTTVDVLSGGRAELGIGAAWYEREHEGLGVPFPPVAERFERLEESLQICLQMWSDDNGPYTGKHYELGETLNSPPALSKPHPPIMIGGMGEKKTLRLVARYGDACNLFSAGHDVVAHKLDVLRRHCEAEGTDYNAIRKTMLYVGNSLATGDYDEFLRDMAGYVEHGL